MAADRTDTEGTPNRTSRGRGVQSVEVSLAILAALARGGGPMTLKDISAAVGMPPAKVHRYLASFVDCGMVDHRRSDSYDLGPLAVEIGVAAIGRTDFVNRAADRLEELVDGTGATALLSVWGDRGPTVVRWQRSSMDLVTTLGLGSVLSLTRTATGHVFAAFMPRRIIATQLEAELAEPDAGLDRAGLEAVVERVRRDGYAWVDQTYVPGLYAISAPVLNWQGEIEAAITLIARQARLIDPAGPEVAALTAVSRDLAAA